MSNINFDSTTPTAPAGNTNVTWQKDASGNLSAYVPNAGGGVPSGTLHGLAWCDNGVSIFATGTQVGWNGATAHGSVATYNSGAGASQPGCWALTSASASYGQIGITNASQIQKTLFAQWQYYGGLTSTGAGGFWVGITSLIGASLSTANPNGNVVAFRYLQGTDTHWQAYAGTATGTFTIVDTGIAPNTNFHQFKIKQDVNGNFTYYIDNSLVATIAAGSTGIPASTADLDMVLHCYVASGTVALLLNSMGWYGVF